MSFWQAMFHWPDGGIYSNLLASLIWVVPGFLWSKRHFKKLHKHVKDIHTHLGIEP